MFCKVCGKEIKEGDAFCTSCGAKLSDDSKLNTFSEKPETSTNYEDYENDDEIEEEYVQPHRTFKETMFGKTIINYFKHPLQVFSIMKNEDTTSTSIGILVGTIVLYGIFSMLYFITFLKNIVDIFFIGINSLSDNLKNILNIDISDYYDYSEEISSLKNGINTYLTTRGDNFSYFIKSALSIGILILITFVIIEICNAIILKNRISHKNILFISAIGFVPLLISTIVNNILIYISFFATVIIAIFGFIMSLTTIFTGILQVSNKKDDKIYWTTAINNLALTIAIPFTLKISLGAVLDTFIKLFKYLDRLF